MRKFFFFTALLLQNALLGAPVKMVTSTTDLAWAAKEIGGERIEVTSLLKGTENPHFIDAVPEYIRLVAEAKVVCIVGLDLEVGWMPKVLSRSGNAQVQPGGKGYCETGKGVHVLERPQGNLDRSMGDVHPMGNPHFWLSPKHLGQAAGEIAQALMGVDPEGALIYRTNLEKLKHKLSEIQDKGETKIRPFISSQKNPILVEYHKEFAYFLTSYGLTSLGSIEEKPGVAPSAGRLAEIALQAKASKLRFVLAADTSPKKTVERFAELSGLPIITVPVSLQPTKGISDYEAFQSKLIDEVVKVLSAGNHG